MLYNCSRWAVTTILLYKLDVCHRSYLRSILGMCWPNGIISNEDLYIRCGTGPLSQQVLRTHRSMFDHVLRMPKDTPAQLSLQFVVAGSNRYRGQVGRHITNPFDMLRSDLKEKGVKLRLGKDSTSAVSKLGQFRSPHFACLSEETLKAVGRNSCVSSRLGCLDYNYLRLIATLM